MQDRRSETRFRREALAGITVIADNVPMSEDLSKFYFSTHDISKCGMRIRAFQFIPAGSFIRIDIRPDSSTKSVVMSGVVRWTEELYEDERFDFGVEVLDVNDDDREAWQDFLSSTSDQDTALVSG